MKVIQQFLNNSLRNFNYVVISEENSNSVFFDPCDIDQTLPLCLKQGGEPKYLVNTHYHPDHNRHNSKLLTTTSVQEKILEHQEELRMSSSESIKCLFTPGHVLNHKCYLLIEDDKEVGIITGDTVFNAGMGNTKLGGDVEVLYETFKNIITKLSDHLIIYPSHDYFLTNLKFSLSIEPDNKKTQEYLERRESMNLDYEFITTTIGEERLYNPFFRVFDPEFKNKFDKNEKDLFIYLRQLRDKW